jgi:poly-gamma-glutamate capsule biosynthesis protein CapA/YwtB (metallophosphatase superfamily)
MYVPDLEPETGEVIDLHLTPLQIRRMQLVHPSVEDRDWLRERLAIMSRDFSGDVQRRRALAAAAGSDS